MGVCYIKARHRIWYVFYYFNIYLSCDVLNYNLVYTFLIRISYTLVCVRHQANLNSCSVFICHAKAEVLVPSLET